MAPIALNPASSQQTLSSTHRAEKIARKASTSGDTFSVKKALNMGVGLLALAGGAQATPTQGALARRTNSGTNQWDQCNSGSLLAHRHYVGFNVAGDSNNTYELDTDWILSYPGKLKDKLKELGAEVTDQNLAGDCGWNRAAISGYPQGVDRGSVWYKPAFDQESTPNMTSVNLGLQALRTTYPTGEICGVVIGSVGTAIVVLGLASCFSK